MVVTASAKRAVISVLSKHGLDNEARALRNLTRSYADRRNRRDNEHLRLLMPLVLSKDSCCIDIGSHRGEMLGEMVRVAPLGHHVAFEPIPELYRELTSQFPNVDIRATALSNSVGKAAFILALDDPGLSGLRRHSYGRPMRTEEIEVEVSTLDACLPQGFVPRLIKIDVEGAELSVMMGARQTLERHRPLVVFEHQSRSAPYYGATPENVFGFFEELGMRLFDLDGKGPYSLADLQSVYHAGRIWNFIAHD